ncbi:RHS repeat-associated core domain-containing protein [Nucisporomicrobium flavum]|uniref:RHS repeat domain-containing protein n=1 Tax=Nucisporomicrobium flavum TaxID=2785915 RepID=UPI003C2AD710
MNGWNAGRGTRRKMYAAATAWLLTVTFVGQPTAALAAAGLGTPPLPKPHADKVVPVKPTAEGRRALARASTAHAATDAAAQRARLDQARPAVWPTAATATLTISGTGTATATPGSLPVTAAHEPTGERSAAVDVRVRTFSRAQARRAGVDGVLLSVASEGGTAANMTVGVGYAGFAGAYGGDFGGRLTVSHLPACALTSPERAACRTRTPVPFHNRRTEQRVDAKLPLPAAKTQPMLLALTAGTKSGAGSFSATPLSASSTWQAGSSSGSFAWSYPLKAPPTAAGPMPDLTISYDSGRVDGQTASSNNQGTTVGTGFDITSSYIERSYNSCDDDGHKDKHDLCWKYDNASLVLNGKASELVMDDPKGDRHPGDGKPETWRLKDDDGTKVEHLSGADNGAHAGEYWKVTTGEGDQYVFGLDRLPGADKDTRTHSVWTVPVFGDDADEPCHGDTFDTSDCVQAWRWNLDYVTDTHHNAMTYWYTAEHNNYAKNGKDKPGTNYVRGGYLDRIEYGQRDGHLFDSGTHPTDKVVLQTAERCLQNCDGLTYETKANWPDVPFDAICADDESCIGRDGPTFFTRKRLTGITTFAWKDGAFQPVDSWALRQRFLDPGDIGDSSDQSLWLDSITHTGHIGGDLSLAPVTFTHTWRTNRVDKTDDILPLNKPRLNVVTSETGAVTTITYSDAQCDADPNHRRMPAAEDDNDMRCFPVRWRPNGGDGDRQLDWFHKYVVTDVQTTDPIGGSRPLLYHYDYSSPAWHYTEDPMSSPSERTWSQWRGFAKVSTITGDPTELTPSKTTTIYLQGMNRDRRADGSKRSVTASGITAAPIADDDALSGFARESVTYNGVGGPEVSGVVSDPWRKQTAERHYSWVDVSAGYTRTAATHSRVRVTSGAAPTTRHRTVTTTYDDYGLPSAVEDQGDEAVTGDETCARTWYARNPAAGLTSLVSRTQTLATVCTKVDAAKLPADSTTSGDVISDTAFAYDTTAYSDQQVPTRGEPRWAGRAGGYRADRSPVWQTVNTTVYDDLGRITSRTDALQHTSTTSYEPADHGPLTQTTATDPKGYSVVTDIDPALGLPTTITDPNSRITTLTYDSFGRLTKVFLPNIAHPAGTSPNIVYGYHLSSTDASYVSTATLRGNSTSKYNTTYQLYDSLLRPRQVQSPSPLGGRLLNETFYDSRGQKSTTYADIYDDKNEPDGQLYGTLNAQPPAETQFTYDGAGRVATSTFLSYGAKRWSTTASYTGDSAATTAVTGDSASREFTDVFGRVTERRTYAGSSPDGATYTSTSFTFTPSGQPKTITGPDKASWSYGYDLFGRKTYEKDPDKGETTTGYTTLDQVEWTKDANQKKLIYEYDELGRRAHEWAGSKSDATLQATWGYDNVFKGVQDSSTRYVGGLTGKAYTKRTSKFDDLYRGTASELQLPADDPLVTAGVPATLKFSNSYNVDGTPQYTDEPAVAGLPHEPVSFGYNALGMPTTMAGDTGYLLSTAYDQLGQLQQQVMGTSKTNPKQVTLTSTYEPGTHRLKTAGITDTSHNYKLQDLTYGYDDAGNVTSITDASTLGGSGQADNQCFAYDGYRRLTEAWTPKTADCAPSGRVATNLGGAAPYWSSYWYNDAGLRKTETQHAVGGDTLITYIYAENGAPPHALSSTSTAKSGTTAVRRSYGYDAAGNTIDRPGTTAQQTLTWDGEGKLQTLTESTTKTGYLYDADGGLLIRRATSGSGDTVLYLGATEVHLNATTKRLSGSRYYSVGNRTVAVRTATAGVTGSKLNFLAGDNHGTASLAIEGSIVNGTPVAQTYTKRYTTPFGAPRGTKPANWPDDKGFLGKTADTTTGLTHIGAREYDPSIGRFISVDPVLNSSDEQSLNGYTYAGNNPTTLSDPTGLDDCRTGGQGCVDPDGDGVYKPPTGGGSKPTKGGGSTPSKGNGSGTKKDWSPDHNAAVATAVEWIKATHPELEVHFEYPVVGGSKQKKNGVRTGNDGAVDIIAFDHKNKRLFVWEVKIGRDNQTARGFGRTEERGPGELDDYMADLRKNNPEVKGYDMEKGFAIPRLYRDPAPSDPKSTLVVESAVLSGRPAPEFDGIIRYWTRRRQDEKQNTSQSTAGETRGQERGKDDGKHDGSWGWLKPVGGGALLAGGVLLLTATVVEDVATGGAGVADDVVSVPAGIEMVEEGAALVAAGG